MKGNGCNVNATLGSDIEERCTIEELNACQTKCLGLEQDGAIQQHTLQKAFTWATNAKKECLNSVENIEHYHQTLIDMKE